ncbi:MAG: aldo/keto reductase [Woeseiaceae bacterium]|nr:aldo/keto reductase [Woeseiaceae bacterium]NIP19979.1 aldo/keto reductase [Woeseiaceae bacterium]NIS88775.1 aldo/keto reductase [Woeseiaceae bacterium]
MKYRHLGKAGIQTSELSLGSWITFQTRFGVDTAVELMGAAFDAGVNFFDNAEAYAHGQSEEVMGAALKRLGWRRGSYLVATKLFWGLNDGPNESNTLNRKYLIEGIDGSLQRLGMDYVDLLYCHRSDPTTPIEETVWAMHNIIERGKALYWGTSEWSAAEILEAIQVAESHHLHKPIVEQPIYNLFDRHRFAPEYDAVYEDYGYGSTTWSPLASGLLTGKYNDGIPEGSRGDKSRYDWLEELLTDQSRIAKVRALEPLAQSMGATLAQFSIAWCLQNPYVSSVITGATRLEQVEENMKALDFVDAFTPEVMAEIDKIFGVD